MGLELWSYSNDSPRKPRAIEKDAAASARSPIRRRHAPPVVRRTIDLRRIPPASYVSPSVREALAAAEASRSSHNADAVSSPDPDETDEFPPFEEPLDRHERAQPSLPRRNLARESVGVRAIRSSPHAAARTSSTNSFGPLRRARPLRDDSLEIARRAVRTRSRHADYSNAQTYSERRAFLREARDRREAREAEHILTGSIPPGSLAHGPPLPGSLDFAELPWPPPPGDRSTSDPSLEQDAAEFPPLRRMGRRQVTDGPSRPSGLRQSSLRESWSPANVDGLGDRERSVSSPPSDHWETMLTTITPDAQLPSADSSFTSAAASASFSTSNTTSQAGTQSTRAASDGSASTDLTEPLIERDEEQLFCETDDEDDGLDRFEFEGRGSRRRPRISRDEEGNLNVWATAPSPPARNPSRYSSVAHSRLREITNIIRNHHADSASRPQSPRSRDRGPEFVDRFTDTPANDERRDSAAVVPDVSRPGSARNEQNSPPAANDQELLQTYMGYDAETRRNRMRSLSTEESNRLCEAFLDRLNRLPQLSSEDRGRLFDAFLGMT